MPQGAWDQATQYGAIGVIAFLAVAGLIWFVISQKNDLKASNTKVISLLETTVKDSTRSNDNLADAIRSLPCNDWQCLDAGCEKGILPSGPRRRVAALGIQEPQ